MVYRDFTLSKVKADFDLRIDETVDLFTGVEAIAPSELLSLTLKCDFKHKLAGHSSITLPHTKL